MNKKLNKPRKITPYSNCEDERLNYMTETYLFHHWIKKGVALIENVDNGSLMEVMYSNFRFND